MSHRPFLLAAALAALGLSQAACASLAQPDEILITAEPAAPPRREAPPAAAAPAPMPRPVEAAPGGGG